MHRMPSAHFASVPENTMVYRDALKSLNDNVREDMFNDDEFMDAANRYWYNRATVQRFASELGSLYAVYSDFILVYSI